MSSFIPNGLIAIYAALLIAAALHDVATRTIPNAFAGLVLAAAVLYRLAAGDLLTGLIIGAAMFAFMFLLWLRRWVGGGDVKLAAAAAVAVPAGSVANFILAVSLAGGLVALFYLALSLVVRRPDPGRRPNLLGRLVKAEAWRISRRGPIPYATAIAAGGLVILIPTLPFVFSR